MVFAIDLLENENLSGLVWANVLVPFVTSLLIRGPDFERRFNKRVDQLIHSDQNVNINIARTFEFQRLLTIVAAAKWSVFKTSGNPPLISNDLGYVPSINTDNDERGISIPFGNKNMILNIVPKIKRVIVKAVKGNWIPIIEYIPHKIINTTSFNLTVGNYAQNFIFGEDNMLVRNYLKE